MGAVRNGLILGLLLGSVVAQGGTPSRATLLSEEAVGQALQVPEGRRATEQLRAELSSLLRLGVQRPYGLGWSDVPEPEFRGSGAGGGGARASPVVSYLPGHTPAAGLLLHLSGQLLDTDGQPEEVRAEGRRYREAAVQVARGIQASMDSNGRVPTVANFTQTGVSAREPYGAVPTRASSTATLGFLLLLHADTPGDVRIASSTTRLSTWILRQQIRPGVFPVAGELPGERIQRRWVRLDLPDTRDGVLALLLTSVMAEGREGGGRGTEARLAAERVVQHLIRLRQAEMNRPSRHLWFPVFDMDGNPVTQLAGLPPTGHLLASRYSLQTLLAFHLVTGDAAVFDIAKLSAQALESRRGVDGQFVLVDDPNQRFRPPVQPGEEGTVEALTPTWPQGDFGLTGTLRTANDLRVLGQGTFNLVTGRSLPLPLALAGMLTGLTDQLPTADYPLTRGQVEAFVQGNGEFFGVLSGPEPLDLGQRVRRLWALYLLSRWEQQLPVSR